MTEIVSREDQVIAHCRHTWQGLLSRHKRLPKHWSSFDRFMSAVGDKCPSPNCQLMRVNVKKPWSKGNAVWVDPAKGKGATLIGQTFNRLTVIDAVREGRITYLICTCACGGTTKVKKDSVEHGRSKSCGCLLKDVKTSHGKVGTKIYKLWQNMHHKCRNPSSVVYPIYGGVGVVVSPEWDDFAKFYEDMGDIPTGTTARYLKLRKWAKVFCKENCFWGRIHQVVPTSPAPGSS